MRMNGNVLSEKGQVKANARKALVAYVDSNRDVFANAVRNDNGSYSVAVSDEMGNVIYVNFDVSVSVMNAGDRAKRKSKAKVSNAENVAVVE